MTSVGLNCVVQAGQHAVECMLWDTSCGLYAVGNRLWSVCCGVYAVVNMLWSVCCGQHAVECMVWATCCGVYDVECMLWATGCGMYAVGSVLWSVCCGQHAVECMLWSVCCGQHAVECMLWMTSAGTVLWFHMTLITSGLAARPVRLTVCCLAGDCFAFVALSVGSSAAASFVVLGSSGLFVLSAPFLFCTLFLRFFLTFVFAFALSSLAAADLHSSISCSKRFLRESFFVLQRRLLRGEL